ncbi:polysaccharide biosynthesis C-terminal domain-containing protein [Nonlabens sp.]|uniref:MATE family efflux transporter n=1 Tax=Nonlabens sp. TaxID=1888209 RepID=UPI00326495C1
MGVAFLFLSTLIMTNYYDKTIVGEFELARSILLLAGAFVLIGTDRSILQIAGRLSSNNDLSQLKAIYHKIILIYFMISCFILSIILIIPASWINIISLDKPMLFKVLGVLFFYALTLFNTEVFRVYGKHIWSEIYRGIFKYILLFVGVIVLLYQDLTHFILDVFLFSFFLFSIISTLHIYPLLKVNNSKTIITYKEIIKISFPMSLSSLGFFLLLSIDIFFLKYFKGDELIAIYAQPVKIIALIAMIQTTLQSSISKMIADNYYSGNMESLKLLIIKYTRLIALMSFPFLIIFLFFSKSILLCFGEDYVSGNSVLLILLIGTTVNALCGCTGTYMNMTGRQVVFRNIIFITVLINLILNIFLIPLYGMNGAAISSTISLILWNIFTVVYVYAKDRLILILN